MHAYGRVAGVTALSDRLPVNSPSINQSCIFRVVQVIKSLQPQDPLEVQGNNLPAISRHSLMQELHWLPVEQRITYKLAVVTYKTRQTSVPEYLSRHITTRCSTRSLRSSSVPLLYVPFRRTSFGKRSFSTAAPSVWNSLPVSVQNCDDTEKGKAAVGRICRKGRI